MGSKLIWIAASFAYGALSAAIYFWICRGKRMPNLKRRTAIAFGAYTLFGLLVVRVLYLILGR